LKFTYGSCLKKESSPFGGFGGGGFGGGGWVLNNYVILGCNLLVIKFMKGVSVEYPMYFGAKPSIFKLSKQLIKDETEAEKMLWARLNKNQIKGLQLRRQHSLNIFIADFYYAKIKLVIEIDGSIHDIPEYHEYDEGSSSMLEDFGITVIRFTNEQIMDEIDYTVQQKEMTVIELLKQQ
jgi:very-short-patch-repair endonuclease